MKISVVIPAYNVERFLTAAVNSVLKTRYPSMEIIVIDDGSSDGTATQAARLEKHNPGVVRVLREPEGKNRGAGASRNLGIVAAEGDLIAFLDADDSYCTNRFETCVKVFEQCPETDAVYSRSRIVYGENVEGDARDGPVLGFEADGCTSFFEAVLKADSSWTTNSITYRTSFLKKRVGLFNERLPLGQDLELSLRASLIGNFEPDTEEAPVATYRRHAGNRHQGGFSVSWHRTCIKVYVSTMKWMSTNGIARKEIEYLDGWLRSSTYRRTDIWLQRNEKKSAREILLLLGREHPKVLGSKRYWGNLKKAF